MGDSSARQTTDHRLDSWKEIAAFFGRDERTVRRWEKERGLPAHRVPGGARGGVFAYTAELGEWLQGRGRELEAIESEPGLNLPESKEKAKEIESPAPELSEGPPVAPQVVEQRPVASALARSTSHLPVARIAAWLAPLAVLALLIAALSSHRENRYTNALAAPHAPNAEAQELYLKGEYHRTKRTPDDLNEAVDYFTQAIVKDPS